VVCEIAVRGGRVLVHEISAFDPVGLVVGCEVLDVRRSTWRPLAELLIALGYLDASTLTGLEDDVMAAESLDDVPAETRELIEILATVFDALETADAAPDRHDA